MKTMIDLTEMTRGEVTILVGYSYGERARSNYDLDAVDEQDISVTIVRPPELETITPSFVQGFFGKSALKVGRENFFEHYKFQDWPRSLMDQVNAGIELALMDRPLVKRQFANA
jgi:hypothetical protein